MKTHRNPYFHRQPTQTIHHIFNHRHPLPTQSLPSPLPAPSLSQTSSTSKISQHSRQNIHIYPLFHPRPPSQRSNQSSFSNTSSNSNNSQFLTNHHSFVLEIQRSVEGKGRRGEEGRGKENESGEGRLVREELRRKVKELEEKEIELILIKNQNINLITQLNSLKSHQNEANEAHNLLNKLKHQNAKLHQQNLKLQKLIDSYYSINVKLKEKVGELQKVIFEQKRNFLKVAERCERIEGEYKEIEGKLKALEIGGGGQRVDRVEGNEGRGMSRGELEVSFSFMNIQNISSERGIQGSKREIESYEEIRINRNPYTTMYQ